MNKRKIKTGRPADGDTKDWKQVGIRLPIDLWLEFKVMCLKDGISASRAVSDLIRKSVDRFKFIEKTEKGG